MYIGENIAPKTITTNKIDSSGDLITKDITVYGRMIPRSSMINKMKEAHRDFQREWAQKKHKLDTSSYGMTTLIFWTTVIYSIIASALCDSECFLTTAEYKEKFPERPIVDV